MTHPVGISGWLMTGKWGLSNFKSLSASPERCSNILILDSKFGNATKRLCHAMSLYLNDCNNVILDSRWCDLLLTIPFSESYWMALFSAERLKELDFRFRNAIWKSEKSDTWQTKKKQQQQGVLYRVRVGFGVMNFNQKTLGSKTNLHELSLSVCFQCCLMSTQQVHLQHLHLRLKMI